MYDCLPGSVRLIIELLIVPLEITERDCLKKTLNPKSVSLLDLAGACYSNFTPYQAFEFLLPLTKFKSVYRDKDGRIALYSFAAERKDEKWWGEVLSYFQKNQVNVSFIPITVTGGFTNIHSNISSGVSSWGFTSNVFKNGIKKDPYINYVQWYKSEKKPTIIKDTLFYFHRNQPSTAKFNTKYQLKMINTKSSIEDNVEVLSFLTEPGVIVTNIINKKNTQYINDVPAGFNSVKNPLNTGEINFVLYRNKRPIVKLNSKHKVYNPVNTQDFSYKAGGSNRK